MFDVVKLESNASRQQQGSGDAPVPQEQPSDGIASFVAAIRERITMKTTLQLAGIASLLFCAVAAHAETPFINLTVGGEVSPGVYGRVQIGNAPPPPVVYAQPMIAVQRPEADSMEPIYLHVPPGHARNWARHCSEYDACNRPVYFVRSAEYEPGYRGRGDNYRDDDRRGDRRRDEGRGDEGYRGEGRGGEGRRGEGRGDDRD